jgi:hypothetical protein
MPFAANSASTMLFPPTQVRSQTIPAESASNAARADPGARSSTRSSTGPCPAPGLGTMSLPTPDSEAVHRPPRDIIT